MRITAIELYGYELTYAHGEYVMSGGRAATAQHSTLVRIVTNAGIEGWGETATLGATYLPTFTGSTRAALRELAPHLIGVDPRGTVAVERIMDGVLMGHLNAKGALETACWDAFARAVELPLTALLGGVLNEDFPLYEAVPLGPPEEMAAFVVRRGAAGIRRFQLKVGNDPKEDAARVWAVAEVAAPDMLVIADANGGWCLQDAVVAVGLMAGTGVHVEQPCREVSDCALIRARTDLPIVMDETVVTLPDLVRAKQEVGAGAVNLKIGRLGGIGPTVRMRDAATALGMRMCIEDMWGGDVVTAAVAHLAASTRPEALMHASFFNDWTLEHVAGYLPRSKGGRGSASTGPGLGVVPDRAMLGAPLARFE